MSRVVREEYKPFTGSLDIKLISEKLKKPIRSGRCIQILNPQPLV